MMDDHSRIGRHVFGVGAILLGASGLVWGEFATNWHPMQDWMPFQTALAYLAATAFLVGGLAVLWRRTAGVGLLVLAGVYLFGTMLWLPRVINYPQLFGVWSGSAEHFAPFVAALMAYAAAGRRWPAPAMLAARVVFGLCIASFGIAHFTAVPQTAGMVPGWLPLGGRFWALATGWAMLLAGLALVSGILAPLAAWLLTALLMSFAVFVWLPRIFSAPNEHNPWAGTGITLAAAGAAWMVAEVLARRHVENRGPAPTTGYESGARRTPQPQTETQP
jgi:uncharacterized membrane protein YphA (DoxX/SURF4 family)